MRLRVNGVFVLLMLTLSASIWSGCSEQSQPSGKYTVKAVSQLSSTDTGTTVSQPSGTDSGKTSSQLSGANGNKGGSQLSDEDIIKAIDESGIMKRADGSLTVIPPVKVVKKGKQDKGGSWPVNVKFTLTYKMKDGKDSKPKETTALFKIFRAKDNTGKDVWRARVGS